MNRCTQIVTGLGIVLLLAACNRPPTTPQAEPSITPEPPAATTSPAPAAPGQTSPGSLPPPSAPSTTPAQ